MPQFDLALYLPIFIYFSFFFFILYFILNLFVLPFFWNIFYVRYLKQQYNIFFDLLNKIQKIHLADKNLDLANYINKILKIQSSNNNNQYLNEILYIISLAIFKFGKKND